MSGGEIVCVVYGYVVITFTRDAVCWQRRHLGGATATETTTRSRRQVGVATGKRGDTQAGRHSSGATLKPRLRSRT
jgi:hypothetical protein